MAALASKDVQFTRNEIVRQSWKVIIGYQAFLLGQTLRRTIRSGQVLLLGHRLLSGHTSLSIYSFNQDRHLYTVLQDKVFYQDRRFCSLRVLGTHWHRLAASLRGSRCRSPDTLVPCRASRIPHHNYSTGSVSRLASSEDHIARQRMYHWPQAVDDKDHLARDNGNRIIYRNKCLIKVRQNTRYAS